MTESRHMGVEIAEDATREELLHFRDHLLFQRKCLDEAIENVNKRLNPLGMTDANKEGQG